MSVLDDPLRRWLRSQPLWVRARDLQREGLRNAWHRTRITPQILTTPPVMTVPFNDSAASCEVHILTWRKDYLAALWAAKSFYAFAGVDWPLVWHQGGPLSASARRSLQIHFPASRYYSTEDADAQVNASLEKHELPLCRAARSRSFMMRKLVDCLILSRAEHLLIVDSDVLFFRKPAEVLDAVASRSPVSLYNRDSTSYYTVSREALRDRYQLEQVDCLNAGLGLVCRAAAPLATIETYLADPDIYAIPWLTEQTIHAMLASRYGVSMLPATYASTVLPGLTTPDGEPLVTKHYPTHPRPLLYQEGMRHLLSTDFEELLRCRHGKA